MKRKALTVMSIAALIFASAGISFAQNAAPAADAPAKPDAPKVAEKSIADMWRAGGITMYPLGFFAILATTLIIYNFIAIRKKKFLNPEGVKKVEEMVNQLQIKEAIEFCEKTIEFYHHLGIMVSGFIPSHYSFRPPMYEGLPTVENHRKISLNLAIEELKACGIDEILFSDAYASNDELKLLSYHQKVYSAVSATN